MVNIGRIPGRRGIHVQTGHGIINAARIEAGAVEIQHLVDGIFAATAAGRLKMAAGYLELGHFPAGLFTADATGRAKFANGFVDVNLTTGIASQAALDAHAALDKSTAHPGTMETADLADGALSADAAGRLKMAAGYLELGHFPAGLFTADATGRGKYAAGFVDASLLGALAVETAKLAADAVTNTKILLANNAYLRARNAANTADVGLIRLGADDSIEMGGAVIFPTTARLPNNIALLGRNIEDMGDIALIRASAGNVLQIGPTATQYGHVEVAGAGALVRVSGGFDVTYDSGNNRAVINVPAGKSYHFRINDIDKATISSLGDLYVNGGSTTMTDPFILIPAAAGVPTGVPSSSSATRAALYFDSTNNRLYVYKDGVGWKFAELT